MQQAAARSVTLEPKATKLHLHPLRAARTLAQFPSHPP